MLINIRKTSYKKVNSLDVTKKSCRYSHAPRRPFHHPLLLMCNLNFKPLTIKTHLAIQRICEDLRQEDISDIEAVQSSHFPVLLLKVLGNEQAGCYVPKVILNMANVYHENDIPRREDIWQNSIRFLWQVITSPWTTGVQFRLIVAGHPGTVSCNCSKLVRNGPARRWMKSITEMIR